MINSADIEDLHNKWPYRQRNNIAAHLKRNVCLCREPGKLEIQGSRCSNCHKLPVYWIYRCVQCDKDFLHDFALNFCFKMPECWDCNKHNEACVNHTYCISYIQPNQIKPPSTKLKPAFTEEDLADVFDFN